MIIIFKIRANARSLIMEKRGETRGKLDTLPDSTSRQVKKKNNETNCCLIIFISKLIYKRESDIMTYQIATIIDLACDLNLKWKERK